MGFPFGRINRRLNAVGRFRKLKSFNALNGRTCPPTVILYLTIDRFVKNFSMLRMDSNQEGMPRYVGSGPRFFYRRYGDRRK